MIDVNYKVYNSRVTINSEILNDRLDYYYGPPFFFRSFKMQLIEENIIFIIFSDKKVEARFENKLKAVGIAKYKNCWKRGFGQPIEIVIKLHNNIELTLIPHKKHKWLIAHKGVAIGVFYYLVGFWGVDEAKARFDDEQRILLNENPFLLGMIIVLTRELLAPGDSNIQLLPSSSFFWPDFSNEVKAYFELE